LKTIQYAILFIFILFGIISCDNDSTDLGKDLIETNTRLYYIDSLTINSSTFQFDSIIVSSTNRLLLGAYTDPTFGVTKSEIYTNFSSNFIDIDNDAVYDSIALILNYDTYFYNDTTATQEIKLYKVLQTIRPDEDDYYYNTSNFEIDNTPLAIQNFTPKPNKLDSVHVSINSDFGQLLFNDIQGNEFNDYNELINEYKGFLITPNINNTAVLGFENTSLFRLYYTIPDGTDNVEKTLDLTFNTNNSFHNISSNQTGTPFESLNDQSIFINSSEINNTSFMQSGTGILTRIDVPHLESLGQINGTGTILEANLKITLKNNSNSEILSTRDSLSLFVINQKSEVVSELLLYSGDNAYAFLGNDENTEFDTQTYRASIKTFVDLKLTHSNRQNYYLAIYPQDFNSSVDRYILNGESLTDDIKLKLELIYAVYD